MDDISERILSSLGTPMLPELEKGGITREVLVEQLKTELAATETKVFNNNGKLIYSDPSPAWEIRQKARMDCQKLLAVYPVEKYQFSLPPLSNLSDEEIEAKIAAHLEERSVKDKLKAIGYQTPEEGETAIKVVNCHSERTEDKNE